MRMPARPAAFMLDGRTSPSTARFSAAIALMREAGRERRENGVPAVSAQTAAEIAQSRTGGSPLPPSVRAFMEPRFGADFSRVPSRR